MNPVRICILFNEPTYYPGQLVCGNVTVVVAQIQELQIIKLKFKGKAVCISPVKKRNDVKKAPKAKEKYVSIKVELVGDEGGITLEAGEHRYPFSIKLPENIPATFRCSSCNIVYYAEAKIIKAEASSGEKTKAYFIVKNLLNLSYYPILKDRCTRENIKVFSSGCCSSSPISLTVATPHVGFLCSEEVPLTVDVDNSTKHEVRLVYSTLNLVARVTNSKTNIVTEEIRTIKKIEFGRVGRHSWRDWKEFLKLESEDHVVVLNCGLVSVYYEIATVVELENGAKLKTTVPVIFGDMPFDSTETGPVSEVTNNVVNNLNVQDSVSSSATSKIFIQENRKNNYMKPHYPAFIFIPGVYHKHDDIRVISSTDNEQERQFTVPKTSSNPSSSPSSSDDDSLLMDLHCDDDNYDPTPWLIVNSQMISNNHNCIQSCGNDGHSENDHHWETSDLGENKEGKEYSYDNDHSGCSDVTVGNDHSDGNDNTCSWGCDYSGEGGSGGYGFSD